MAVANLHETIQASIIRRNQLNLELTQLAAQKSLATYSQADVQSLLSSEKHAVRDYFKGLYEDDEDNIDIEDWFEFDEEAGIYRFRIDSKEDMSQNIEEPINELNNEELSAGKTK
mgnify:CR=1 FL=1